MDNKIQYSKPVPPFVKFCAVNIPVVFDDSLSYYEALCALWKWMQDNLVDVINNNAAVTDYYIEYDQETRALFIQLKEYVDTYFDNLDVQEEINNKLDAMVEDGTFEEICGRLFDQKVDYYEITNQTEEEVQELFSIDRVKIISFKNDYTFNETRRLTANTTILLNNHTLTFNVPSVNDDYVNCHGFFNFEHEDSPLVYGGNGNISIIGGKIIGGNCSFAHASNIVFKDVYFENCKNNHILEMCAIDGLLVDGCTFAGIPAGSTGEYIQNDSAIYAAFPWFESDNPTYDNTQCKNLVVKNTKFTRSSNAGYIHYSSFGTHQGSGEGTATTNNIVISNCEFDKPELCSIQLYNVDGLTIEDTKFIGTSTDEPSIHIRIRSGVKNVNITNNTFEGMVRAIETARERLDVYNVNILNNIFTKYNNATYPTYAILDLWDNMAIRISNNIFRNFSQTAIKARKSDSYDPSKSYEIDISANSFTPLHALATTTISVGCGKGIVTGNTFDCTGYTPTTQMVLSNTSADSFYFADNLFSTNVMSALRECYDNTEGFANVYDIKKQAWSGNTSSGVLTNTEYTVANFNTLILTVGYGSNTQTITIKAFSNWEKLDSRTWKFPLCTADSIVAATLTLDTVTNTLTFASSGTAVARSVILCNTRV